MAETRYGPNWSEDLRRAVEAGRLLAERFKKDMEKKMPTVTKSDTSIGRILTAIINARDGATVDELVITLGFKRSSVAGRVRELVARGAIKSVAVRKNRRGVMTRVYAPASGFGHCSSPIMPPPAATPAPAPTKTLRNHFIFVSDHSGSMNSHRKGAAQLFNKYLDTILAEKNQVNTVTGLQFGLDGNHGPKRFRETYFNVPAISVRKFADNGSDYEATGNTPLYDAIIKAAQRGLCDQTPDQSFVVFILTDGEENASLRSAQEMRDLITKLQATDHWTFAAWVPRGYKAAFVTKSGIHEANVQEWDVSGDVGVQTHHMSQHSNSAYFGTRSAGYTSSTSYFQANLNTIQTTDLSQLTEIHPKSWLVDRETDILTAINYHTGGKFAPGTGFYQLTKAEKNVQGYKELILEDRATGKFYSNGAITVRQLLGLPSHDCPVEPGNLGLSNLYIQSTSTNRKLVRGSRVIFWEK